MNVHLILKPVSISGSYGIQTIWLTIPRVVLWKHCGSIPGLPCASLSSAWFVVLPPWPHEDSEVGPTIGVWPQSCTMCTVHRHIFTTFSSLNESMIHTVLLSLNPLSFTWMLFQSIPQCIKHPSLIRNGSGYMPIILNL